MSLFSVLKQNAKLALRSNWGKAIPIFLIPFGVSMILYAIQSTVLGMFVDPVDLDPALGLQYGFDSYLFNRFAQASMTELWITLAFGVVSLLINAPLSLGMSRWFYELIQGRVLAVSEIFRYFESIRQYGRSLWLEVNLSVRTSLWALPFYLIPVGVMSVSAFFVVQPGTPPDILATATMGFVLSAALILLASVFYCAFVCRYTLTPYLLAEEDGMPVRQAIKTSIAHTKGYRFSLLGFQLTFIGWMLLSIFLFPMLYVVPYVNASMAMYSRYIIEKNRYAAPSADSTQEFGPAGPPPTGEAVAEEPTNEQPPTDLERSGADEPPEDDDFHFPPSNHPASSDKSDEEPPATSD